MNYSETSSILKPYDNVLTIKTVSGDVPVYKLMEMSAKHNGRLGPV